jgi:hypothetical protein
MEKNCLEYRVIIQGQYTNDDGLEIDMGALTAAEALYELPLVRCPDCQGDLVSGETRGYGPRTLQCVGLPLGGRPTNPLRDVRVPSPDIDLSRGRAGYFPRGDIGDCASQLFAERHTCTAARAEEIDRELIRLLYPWLRLHYPNGCGSIFSVQSRGGRIYLRREHFYEF